MLIYFIHAIISLIICYAITKKSGMSMEWAFFFALTFSIIVACIFVISSGEKGGQKKYDNKFTKSGIAKRWMCYLIGIFLFIAAMNYYPSTDRYYFGALYESTMIGFIYCLGLSLGFIGNGIYLSTDADVIFDNSEVQLDTDKVD